MTPGRFLVSVQYVISPHRASTSHPDGVNLAMVVMGALACLLNVDLMDCRLEESMLDE